MLNKTFSVIFKHRAVVLLLEMNLSIEEKSLGFLLTILNESNDPYVHLSESDLLCLQLASVDT